MSEDLSKLTHYVNQASDLAESLQADLKKGKTVSTKTIVALAKFIKAADTVKDMLEVVTEKHSNLN